MTSPEVHRSSAQSQSTHAPQNGQVSAASLSLTEIADSPDWLQRVWTSAPDAMALSDAEGIVMMANPAYCELYGYQPEEIVGRSFAVIFPPAAREQAIQQYRDVYAGALATPVH